MSNKYMCATLFSRNGIIIIVIYFNLYFSACYVPPTPMGIAYQYQTFTKPWTS